jgi:outer membrane protein insertion porin family
MGDGQSATVNLSYGAETKSVVLGFSEPWLLDRPTSIGFSANYNWWEGYTDPDITRYGGSVYVGRRLKWPDDYFSVQGGLSLQWNDQGPNVDGSMVKYTGFEFAPFVTLVRDDKNLPIFPSDGSRYSATVSYVPSALSDFSFVKTDLSVKWYFPIWGDKLHLAITNEFGFMAGDTLQYRDLYQMGGALGYSGLMRGYSAGSIGAYRIGRAYQYFGAEFVVPIAPNRFYLLPFFFDAGNVFGAPYNSSEPVKKLGSVLKDWDPSSLKRDVGFGFRVIVPMLGMIGFDFAWPLDPGESGGYDKSTVGGMEFNFIIGQGF